MAGIVPRPKPVQCNRSRIAARGPGNEAISHMTPPIIRYAASGAHNALLAAFIVRAPLKFTLVTEQNYLFVKKLARWSLTGRPNG